MSYMRGQPSELYSLYQAGWMHDVIKAKQKTEYTKSMNVCTVCVCISDTPSIIICFQVNSLRSYVVQYVLKHGICTLLGYMYVQ